MGTKISEMEAGKKYNVFLLITNVEEAVTTTGKPYVIVTGQDEEKTSIRMKLWDATTIEDNQKQNIALFDMKKGELMYAQLNVKTYKDALDYTIERGKYREANEEDDVNINDFIRRAPQKSEDMKKELLSIAEKYVVNPVIKKLLFTMYEDERFMTAGAAKSFHHNYIGGLLQHTLHVTKNAIAIANNYNDEHELDMSIIVAGSMLHDVGKLKELASDEMGVIDYTLEGGLLGHLGIGLTMVNQTAVQLGISLDDPYLLHLEHVVASHHAMQELGAIVPPKTMEAKIVAVADDMDAKMFQFMEEEPKEIGTIAQKRSTGLSFNAYNGVYVYNPIRYKVDESKETNDEVTTESERVSESDASNTETSDMDMDLPEDIFD